MSLEIKIKHLEFIQRIVERMGRNSFNLKGWTITIVSALFVLNASVGNVDLLLITFIPIISFWILDSYYLRQEKLFRKLYSAVSSDDGEIPSFSMDTQKFEDVVDDIPKIMFSISLRWFYFIIIGTMVVVYILSTANN